MEIILSWVSPALPQGGEARSGPIHRGNKAGEETDAASGARAAMGTQKTDRKNNLFKGPLGRHGSNGACSRPVKSTGQRRIKTEARHKQVRFGREEQQNERAMSFAVK